MRNPGERSVDRAPGRRRGPAGRNSASGQAPGAGEQPALGGSSLFVPGYAGEPPAAGEPDRPGPSGPGAGRPGGWHSPATGLTGKGPVRGFPPAPGQPPPVYPPGQFSAWNRASRPADGGYVEVRQGNDGWAAADYPRPAAAGGAGSWPQQPGFPAPGSGEPSRGRPDYAEPGYSVLAVSDPAADVTSTQSWEAVDAPSAARSRGAAGAQPAAQSWGAAGAQPAAPPWEAAGAQSWEAAGAPPWEAAGAPPATSSWPDRGAPLTDRADHPGQPRENGLAGQNGGPASAPAGQETVPPRSPAARTERAPARRAHARSRGGKRRGLLLLACGLVVVLVIGAAAYVWFSGGHHGSGTASAASKRPATARRPAQSASPTPSPSLGHWGHIDSRTADPLPLTLTELFPATFTAGGGTYSRTVQRDGTKCSRAVIGAALQSAVRKGKCTQVMRASYLSGNGKMMGTIGVLNLVSVGAAERSGKAAGGGDFIAQLPAAKGPARHLTRGTGLEETEIKGHFLVMVWAEFANLHAPKNKTQRLAIETFCNRLIQNTANLSLASRMITGKPRVP
jgi:hypothetical protein